MKTLVFVFIFMNFSITAFSQNQNSDRHSNFWDHVRFGGGIGLSFGDGFFSGTLAPSAIYQFNSELAMGLGLNGTYNKQKNVFKSTIFGASVIGLYNPIPELQLSGEFEELNVNRKFDNSAFEDQNYWYPALFAGIGYRSNNITLGIRYDVLYDREKSIYADPWMPFIRVFF
ncbi:alpha-ketoglutarate decarboxylase [Psychroserpens algicola]|uniref:Alpha-ketoglutarate decarboxylase n=1 Tax=Psychroserpens algicola TaxID=1719034 RepID=A0ABT0HA15_9FLAO|nr:alpha-ketoglutarate decarboxylase [Psychroserpens algicola]MCK8481017.1 alpha-ketoglutarate decarboxylase [Psychroserpens algicola]